jgi:hypothetical protein
MPTAWYKLSSAVGVTLSSTDEAKKWAFGAIEAIA